MVSADTPSDYVRDERFGKLPGWTRSGKCLIYGPAVLDYEYMSTKISETLYNHKVLEDLITSVSPYVDIWMIQLAKYQRWTDAGRDDIGNPLSMSDFYE